MAMRERMAGGQMGDAILLHTTRYPSYHCKLLEFLTKEAITVHGLFFINCYHYCPVIISDTNQHYLFFLDRIKENETNDLDVIIHFINFAYGI